MTKEYPSQGEYEHCQINNSIVQREGQSEGIQCQSIISNQASNVTNGRLDGLTVSVLDFGSEGQGFDHQMFTKVYTAFSKTV